MERDITLLLIVRFTNAMNAFNTDNLLGLRIARILNCQASNNINHGQYSTI